MNAKREKSARRLFKKICKRNGVEPSMSFWKSYRKDLQKHGMWFEFLRQSLLPENAPEFKKPDVIVDLDQIIV